MVVRGPNKFSRPSKRYTKVGSSRVLCLIELHKPATETLKKQSVCEQRHMIRQPVG